MTGELQQKFSNPQVNPQGNWEVKQQSGLLCSTEG